MRRLLSVLLIAVISAYRKLLSPFLPRSCRFHPSCSAYAIEAIEKFGPWCGLLRSILRICRCHPWHPGGVDPVG